MVEIILAEKPSAAGKIAFALGANVQKTVNKIKYFTNRNEDLIVAAAVGHLFGLSKKKGAKYPCFELEWKPTYNSKSSSFSKPYFDVLASLAKKADSLIIATDYDVEGEVIGLNIMKYIFNKKDAHRMKFSTLTVPDLKKAYLKKSKSIDWGQAYAGEARHYLDWYYGINLSHALSKAVAVAENRRVVLSIGRVQGPALSLLSERELEIKKFKPVLFWELQSKIKIAGKDFIANYVSNPLQKKSDALSLFEKTKREQAIVSDLKSLNKKVSPPVPFDLTSLQIESYRVFGMSPKRTLQVAQELYTHAYISYPRTSSQKLPSSLGLKKILEKLKSQSAYKILAEKVLSGNLKPNEGPKIDSAHPAIFPTGQKPVSISGDNKKLYDLIVKRFFAVFGDLAERVTDRIEFDIDGLKFQVSGTRTLKRGWMDLYAPYSTRKEEELPKVNLGDKFSQKSALLDKETSPPKRFSQASIISELEKRSLGTKATRASIVDILFERNYVQGHSIEVTDLGLKVFSSLKKYAPLILSEDLTREFEDEMNLLREKKSKLDSILLKARKSVTEIWNDIEKHETNLGKELYEAFSDVRKDQTELMKCLKCHTGMMVVRFSRKTGKRFLACNAYPKCMTCWPLPQNGKLDFMDKTCPDCGARMIVVYKAKRKPWVLCPNPACSSKEKQDASVRAKSIKPKIKKRKIRIS